MQPHQYIQRVLSESRTGDQFLEGCIIDKMTLVTAQTMHDVYFIPGKEGRRGCYLKFAKDGGNQEERRELETEAIWYNVLRNNFQFPKAPRAETFSFGEGAFAIGVEEIIGKTYEEICRDLGKEKRLLRAEELQKVINISARIATLGARFHKEYPIQSPTYFGDFNEGEHLFLKKRIVKLFREEGFTQVEALERILEETKEPLTNSEFRLFYRDATPLNWINHEGEVVAIDLGSTGYRPPQFEMVALFETPNTGFESLDEGQRVELVLRYKEELKREGVKVETDAEFIMKYGLASLMKNLSGIASRISHIRRNRKDIESEDRARVVIGTARLAANIAGKEFHRERAIKALTISEDFLKGRRAEYKMLRTALESL